MLNPTPLARPHSRSRLKSGLHPHDLFTPTFRDRRAPDQLRLALHDRLGPGLVNLERQLACLEEGIEGSSLPTKQVASLRLAAAQLTEELRRIVHDRPPERLERDGLVAAVRAAAAAAAQPGLEVAFACSGEEFEPTEVVAAVIYRAAVEATANVIRHAQATSCWVFLRFSNEAVTLKVRDNGVGPGGHRDPESHRAAGLGLESLRASAHSLGGKAQLLRRREGGASLIVTLPQRRPVNTRRFRRFITKPAEL